MDSKRGRAYTHAAGGKTIALDLGTHAVVAQWEHGCEEASGLALDEERGFLFIACAEGAIGVSSTGNLSVLGTFPGTKDSHCVAANGRVFFADPAHGRLHVLKDPFPASAH